MYSFYRFENAPFIMKNVEKETVFRQCDEIVDISDTARAYLIIYTDTGDAHPPPGLV